MKRIFLATVVVFGLFCAVVFADVTGDGMDGLDDGIFILQRISGLRSGPGEVRLVNAIYYFQTVAGIKIERAVSEPVLRATLPGSWDESWFDSPAVFDLDNDGNMEIIASRSRVLHVWNSSGASLWHAPVGQNATIDIVRGESRQYASPVVGDLNGNGRGEIGVAYGNKVAVYNATGTIIAGWPVTFPGSSGEIRSLTAVDMNNDGIYEFVASKTNSGPITAAWDIDGNVLSGWPQVQNCNECNEAGAYNQNTGAADMDDDGIPEIVTTYDRSRVGIMYTNGVPYPANAIFSGPYASSISAFHDIELAKQGWGEDGNDRDQFTDSAPVFADIDGDGLSELVLYSDHEVAGVEVIIGNCLWVLNSDMTRAPGFETPICSGTPLFTGYQNNVVQVAPSPAVARIAGDSRPEIIVPSYDGCMRCYSPDGDLLWSYQFDSPGGAFIGASGVAAGDLNFDGSPEIIFTTYSTSVGVSHLIILGAAGNELHKILLDERGSMATPTLADVDGDGILEILISLKDTLGGDFGGVQVWNVASAIQGYLPWPTGRGNYLRNGQPGQ